MPTVTPQTMWQKIAPIETALWAIGGALPGVIMQGGMPHTLGDVLIDLLGAAFAAGALHRTAPRNQGAYIVPPTNVAP